MLCRLEESIPASFDDWSESNQAQKFFFSPDRQAARAVVSLLSRELEESHRRRLLKILPYCLLHPAEEARRYTALSLGANCSDLAGELLSRCTWVMLEEIIHRLLEFEPKSASPIGRSGGPLEGPGWIFIHRGVRTALKGK